MLHLNYVHFKNNLKGKMILISTRNSRKFFVVINLLQYNGIEESTRKKNCRIKFHMIPL